LKLDTWNSTPDTVFWQSMTLLINTNAIIIDRPRGKTHPRYSDMFYPLDYGYLAGTKASDGDGIDVWIGSLTSTGKILTGILCTFDTLKHDAEIKVLIGCTRNDIQIIQEFLKQMCTLYVPNPLVNIP
jgi:inorganic pyrophosphatase